MMRAAGAAGALIVALLGGAAGVAPASAQDHGGYETKLETAHDAVAPASRHEATDNQIDIMHHIGNSSEVETPFGVWHLPHWEPIHVGNVAIDLSPTKHLVYLVLAALIVALIFTVSARSVARAQAQGRPPKGFAGAVEAVSLYIRQEVILPNVGHHGEGFAPFLLTLFFFILTMNLLGLVPWGATATGNLSVTATLALMTFITTEVAGMRSLGAKGYLHTIFYLPPGLPTAMKPIMLLIMVPVEIIGKLSKPFALAVRLFANMTAGHVLVLALLGLTFLFKNWGVGIGASLLATGVMLLEVFVAFLQAFVFTLLSSVFIGLIRAEH